MQKFVLFLAGCLFLSVAAFSQNVWELRKDENGIRIYTRQKEDRKLLAYRIETQISGNLEEVYRQVIDFHGNKKYLDRIDTLRILEKKKDQQILIYMMFNVPWPFRDRDFVNRMLIDVQEDTVRLESSPGRGEIPPKEGVIRMQEFSEYWVLAKKAENLTALSLQGYADPGGSLPDWVINLFVVQEPHTLVRGIKMEVESNRRGN